MFKMTRTFRTPKSTKELKPGQYVFFQGERCRIYGIYGSNRVSLPLRGYPDTEADGTFHVSEIQIPVYRKFKGGIV